MESYFHQVLDQDIDQYRNESQRRPRAGQYLPLWKIRQSSYDGHPTPVHASVVDRMSEIMAHRQNVCIYNQELQQSKVLHIRGEQSTGYRLLIHFYEFVFYENYHADLWMKRFIRDHFRVSVLYLCRNVGTALLFSPFCLTDASCIPQYPLRCFIYTFYLCI
jgi:hypothetical protein